MYKKKQTVESARKESEERQKKKEKLSGTQVKIVVNLLFRLCDIVSLFSFYSFLYYHIYVLTCTYYIGCFDCSSGNLSYGSILLFTLCRKKKPHCF